AQTTSDALTIRKTTDFAITGDGTANAWNTTEWIVLEKRRGAANYRTRAKMLYSETGVYALFHNEDAVITSTLDEDFTDLWKEDVVEIFLWPDETYPLYFEYELSPLNRELAILVPNINGHYLGWRPWHYEGGRRTRHATYILRTQDGTPRAWIAECFIPYTLLRPLANVPPSSGTQWRANLYRLDHDHQSTAWSWKPVQKDSHDYQQFGTILFE